MSQEFLERLSRFTPDTGGLDRDALLFAAGKASARPDHRWVVLAALLANTQIVSLVLLWPRQVAPEHGLNVARAKRFRSRSIADSGTAHHHWKVRRPAVGWAGIAG